MVAFFEHVFWTGIVCHSPQPNERPLAAKYAAERPPLSRNKPNLQFVYFRQNVFRLQVGRGGVHLLKPDDSLLVDDNNGAVGCASLIIVYTVQLRDVPFGMKIRKQRIWYIAERTGIYGLRWPWVCAYTQYLGIFPLEFRVCDSERGNLLRSATCKRKYVKGKDNVLVALVLAECYVVASLTGNRKVRR